MSPLPNHSGSATAAFVVRLLLCIAKRLEHLTAVAIFDVFTGDLNAAAVLDLCNLDLAALFFHLSSPPFFLILFYNNRTVTAKKYNYFRKSFIELTTSSFTLQRKVWPSRSHMISPAFCSSLK